MVEALRDIQRRFLAGVVDSDADAETLIIDDARVGATRRLDVYRHNYRTSLSGVLADHFERLHAYLGDEQFDNLAAAYVASHPSRLRNLRYYGADFAAFLAHHYPDDGELGELGELDWAMRHAFDAADAAPLDAAQVGALGDSWIDRKLTLHPSAQLLTAQYNVVAIWSALDREEAPPAAESLATPVPLLVWRLDYQPQFRSLLTDESDALALVAAGCSFTDLSARIIDRLGEADAMQALSSWLARWLADAVLTLAD